MHPGSPGAGAEWLSIRLRRWAASCSCRATAGELYELFCCRDGEFVSLGQRIGDRTHELRYEEVPGNALLLLKNHSKGKDERIFTYEDGRQVWW